jgi:hypothetical protein
MTSTQTEPKPVIQLNLYEREALLVYYLMGSMYARANEDPIQSAMLFDLALETAKRLGVEGIKRPFEELERLADAAFPRLDIDFRGTMATAVANLSPLQILEIIGDPAKLCEIRGKHCPCGKSPCCICGEDL